ncbi:DUF4288 domain-containing protein [Demequina phytophila]|uniref:DUF4288 domain-containing protein n=1 Tax=Demequina phytophila TaxID=1638981 RepID=UPI0007861C1F|nr:DUF4288 domain-containing protein [Demequina phytophila]
MEWYSVRCVFRFPDIEGRHIYEERITLWRAETAEQAIDLADDEARDYVDRLDSEDSHPEYLGLAQSYRLADEVGHGAEVFSIMRDSTLDPSDYIDWFLATGDERLFDISDLDPGADD